MGIKSGKASTKAKNKYNARNYDRVSIVVPKGYKSDILAVAEAGGDSINGYITKAINERIYRNTNPGLKYTIIGGVNGTGKSSFTGVLKTQAVDLGIIIDVDKLTASAGVSPIKGGKMALHTIKDCLYKKISFTQETTLAGHRTKITARYAKENGYYISMFYIGLDHVDECLKRIANRVARGGHNISEKDVRRRFSKRLNSVINILPFCDEAYFFDNNNGFVEVAEYRNGKIKLKGEIKPQWIIELSERLSSVEEW